MRNLSYLAVALFVMACGATSPAPTPQPPNTTTAMLTGTLAPATGREATISIEERTGTGRTVVTSAPVKNGGFQLPLPSAQALEAYLLPFWTASPACSIDLKHSAPQARHYAVSSYPVRDAEGALLGVAQETQPGFTFWKDNTYLLERHYTDQDDVITGSITCAELLVRVHLNLNAGWNVIAVNAVHANALGQVTEATLTTPDASLPRAFTYATPTFWLSDTQADVTILPNATASLPVNLLPVLGFSSAVQFDLTTPSPYFTLYNQTNMPRSEGGPIETGVQAAPNVPEGDYVLQLRANASGITRVLTVNVHIPRYSEFTAGNYGYQDDGPVLATSGGLWYGVSTYNNNVMPFLAFRNTQTGQTTTYPMATSMDSIFDLARGPDGSVWVAKYSQLLRILPGSNTVTTYPPISSPDSYGLYQSPTALAFDSAGRVWFVNSWRKSIGMFDPVTQQTTAYPYAFGYPLQIAVTPDDHVWVTDYLGSSLVEFNIKTATFTSHPVSSDPSGLKAHADGSLWFTESNINVLGHYIPSSGQLTEHDLGAFPSISGQHPGVRSLDLAPDGSVWMTEYATGSIVRFDPMNRHVSRIRLPGTISTPADVSVDAQGGVWVSMVNQGTIGHLRP